MESRGRQRGEWTFVRFLSALSCQLVRSNRVYRASIDRYVLASVNYCLIRQEVPCLLSYIDKFVDLSGRARLRRGHGTRVAAIIASIDSRDNGCRMRSRYRRVRGNKRRLNADSPTISATIWRVRVSVASANGRKS